MRRGRLPLSRTMMPLLLLSLPSAVALGSVATKLPVAGGMELPLAIMRANVKERLPPIPTRASFHDGR